jgi:hypothetical protein
MFRDLQENMGEDTRITDITDPPDFGVVKGTEVRLCGRIDPLGSRSDGLFVIPVCSPGDLCKEARELPGG